MKRWRRALRRLARGDALALVAATVLLLIALWLPPLPLTRPTYDVIVIFDVTQSMNVPDYVLDGRLVSRLDYAKYAIGQALRRPRCDTRIGWGVFAGRKIVLLLAPVEVCSNYSALLAALNNVDGRMAFENASEVQQGLFWAIDNVQQLQPVPNLVFMTDGHEAPPLAPDLMRDYDGPKGLVHGWLLGVGDTTPKPIPKTDIDGNVIGYWHDTEVLQADDSSGHSAEHLSALHEAGLQRLAKTTGLRYRRLMGVADADAAIHTPELARPARIPTDLRAVPAALALLCLLWPWRPALGWWRDHLQRLGLWSRRDRKKSRDWNRGFN